MTSENDYYGGGTDRNYTNGLFLSLTRSLDPATLREWSMIYGMFGRPERGWLRVEIGQELYTPRDLSRRDLIADDRPYGAFLFAGLAAYATIEPPPHAWSQLQYRYRARAGWVGPGALGRQVQTNWHSLINAPRPNGWDHQLGDEPAFSLELERRHRVNVPLQRPWGSGTLYAGCHVGNLRLDAYTGLLLRAGWQIPSHHFGLDTSGPGRRPSAYAFLAGETRLVALDLFLDGNTVRDSHHIAKKVFVQSLRAGLVAAWPPVACVFTYEIRSPEVRRLGRPHRFGSITLAVSF